MIALLLVEDRPRDEQGRFVESSELASKPITVRLNKDIHSKFLALAADREKSPTQLAREILSQFVKDSSN